MLKSNIEIDKIVADIDDFVGLSGVVYMKNGNDVVFESAYGYSNRAEELSNTVNTRFGIASGCKLFTAIGICQLVEKGALSFHTRLKDCLGINFPNFDESITIHHLLTHSSGIQDYFDEEEMDDFEELWKEQPTYLLNHLKDFLPMFQNNQMMFKPGERFHYNNAGFIVLGLIIEQQTGLSFTDYMESEVFNRCGMRDSGYFSLDNLPKNTAYGYIDNEEDGTWRTNVFSIPIKGGADGGAFITAPDMMKLWEGLFNHELLSEAYTNALLNPHIAVKGEAYYGYGIWINKRNNNIFKYHVIGYDPGVSFHSSVYPDLGIKLVVPSNKGYGSFDVTKAIEDLF
ncbi:class C beta-lactamase-related serine hydrolase [Peribacillus cavernae]|uniref:Class C beta-lactamase-related serine hydrolase n=1 Tax=Peribacillus cavernae TaxID=1674310 RepID=A0A3S0TZH8_9BACI|nr:serine hydrolase [Peribacillus cavernae]MDQ0218756.1 CubicO group peptidase (beta-lactamase class C family) [Peribacillus cavernae]RUQ30968.1 class C beta-lactamase-related serine hydrolase [Peribacillus cavernae]